MTTSRPLTGRPPAGLCVLRVEPDRADSPLITVRLSLDAERGTTPTTRQFADAEAALQAIREFLLLFTQYGTHPAATQGGSESE